MTSVTGYSKTKVDALVDAKAPVASPTFTGGVTAPRLAVGAGVTGANNPSNASFPISPSVLPPSVGADVVAHARSTIFTGDWTTSVQVTINGSGGTARWTVGGQYADIAPTAAASAVQAALQGLSTVGAGNLIVTGGPGAAGGGTPYVVKYAVGFIEVSGFLPLTVSSTNLTGGAATATLTWTNQWGGDTGYVFGESAYHVTGTNPGDGNGIAFLAGASFEADQKSDGHIGTMIGLLAEASFAGPSAGGNVDILIGLQVNPSYHKDGASQASGTADTVYGLRVSGVQNARSFTDGVTVSGTPALTSATAMFSSTDQNKVITGAGIPAGTWISSVTSPTAVVLSAAATASASGVSVTIHGTHQASNAYTAWFGAGKVQANGQVAINGWQDEPQLMVTGLSDQVADLQQWWRGGNIKAKVDSNGGVNSYAYLQAYADDATYQAIIGYVGTSGGKPGIVFGGSQDTGIIRDAAGVLGIAGGLRLGTGFSSVTGGRLWSGSGAPDVADSVAGDFYFRTDTPTTANQRIYVATAANTWTGIV